MKRGVLSVVALCLLLSGCPSQPAANNTVDDGPEVENSNHDSSSSQANNSAVENDNTDTGGGNSASRVVEPSAADLAALSVLTEDDFAAVMIDVEKLRGSKLVQKLPGDFAQALADMASQQAPVDLSEVMPEVETLLIAAAPGPGKLEHLFGVEVEAAPREVLPDSEVDPADNEFDPEDARLELNPPEGFKPPPAPLQITLYATFRSSEAVQKLRRMVSPDARITRHGGKEYLQSGDQVPLWIHFGEKHVLLSSREATIQSAIDRRGVPADVALAAQLRSADLSSEIVAAGMVEPVRGQLKELLKAAQDVPPLIMPSLTLLVHKVDRFTLAADSQAKTLLNIDMQAVDEEGAEALASTFNGLKTLGSMKMSGDMNRAKEGGAPAEQLDLMRSQQQLLARIQIQRDGADVDVSLARPDDFGGMFEKAIDLAEKSAGRTQRMIRGHMLGIAAAQHRARTGKPLESEETVESWRVELLPYLEEAGDGEQMPAIYKSDLAPQPGTTTWRMVAPIRRFDGRVRIMFLETGKGTAVAWREVEKFSFHPDDPKFALGEEPEGGYVAVFQDGHVEMLNTDQLVKQLKADLLPDAPD